MSSVSDFSVGVVHELTITAAKAGFTPNDFGLLAKREDLLRQFRKVLLGHAEITVPEHLIDLDADPFVPNGWEVEEHQKGGQFTWDASKVSLDLSKKQQRGVIEGNKLREKLKGQKVFNANLLDDLLKNPHLIPEEWKQKTNGYTTYVFFWGTIYRRSDGLLCVRCLFWRGDRWRWGSLWLDSDWDGGRPAAVPEVEP
jgi:hypothetical protein